MRRRSGEGKIMARERKFSRRRRLYFKGERRGGGPEGWAPHGGETGERERGREGGPWRGGDSTAAWRRAAAARPWRAQAAGLWRRGWRG
jgi:hypothetical protein